MPAPAILAALGPVLAKLGSSAAVKSAGTFATKKALPYIGKQLAGQTLGALLGGGGQQAPIMFGQQQFPQQPQPFDYAQAFGQQRQPLQGGSYRGF